MGGLHYDSLADLPPKMRVQVAGRILEQGKKATKKYRNEPVTVKGIRFDSKKEASRYLQLMDAVREGAIYDLRLQRNFTLLEGYTSPSGERIRPIVYQADFTYRVRWPWHKLPTGCDFADLAYWESVAEKAGDGALVIEDVKANPTRTRAYINKYKMMADQGHHIREV